jgi:hypothetical protein
MSNNSEKPPCDAFYYCDCPLDVNTECQDMEYIDKNHKRYCRKLKSISEPCTCIPYDYTSLSGKNIPVKSFIDEKFITKHDPKCNMVQCSCPRSSDNTCPDNWTPTITNTDDQICQQYQPEKCNCNY